MKKIDKIIITLLIFSFLIRIAFILYSPLRGWDETVYLNLGHELSANPLVYSLLNSAWNDFIPSTDVVYGWPNIGFRAPLLPYIISIFYALKLSFLIKLIVPFFSTLSVFLIYILGKRLFSKEVGLYSAILFALIPIHVLYSGKVLTDAFVVFFILLTFISFWRGYEEENKIHKILFGLFLALSLLARYTTLWITPVFLLYFLIRDRSLKFLKDKYLWYAIGVFFLTLTPWFIYSFVYYNNPIGVFIHGFKSAGYWGGVQSWSFFIENSWYIFSITGILFVFSLLYILFKKEFIKREIYLLLIWVTLFSVIAMAMPHKEDRFILPAIPVICLISGFFISNIKKYRNIIFGLVCIVLIVSLLNLFKMEYKYSQAGENLCFSEGNKFLTSDFIEKNALVVTNQLPIVHYYTQKEVTLYPEPWNTKIFNNDRAIYIFFANYDMTDNKIKKDLDDNFKKVFECSNGWGSSAIYILPPQR
ncbi:MAG: glycosyltransferase family 39 protein [Patescibacteria group bacterium]|nr:glycosyltransferase family 39 protein [Patescibacteria group bacterium]